MKINKDIDNSEIKNLLRAVAATYKIKDEEKHRFRIIAYERAADAVEHLSSEAKDLWDDGKLARVSGIGENIATHIGEIFEKGESKHFKELMSDIPPAVFELIKISGVGPKNGIRLVNELNISSDDPIKQLKKHAEEGRIARLEGFGIDSQNTILQSIKEVSGRQVRMLLPYAKQNAKLLVDWMKKCNELKRIDVLGSLRRSTATVGDIDIAATGGDLKAIIDHFTKYPNSKRVVEMGERTASIIIPPDLQIDLMVQEPESYGALLQHFTGSKHHNIALREHARGLKPGFSLSEYGIKPIGKIKNIKFKHNNFNEKTNMFTFEDEESLYEFLGMGWVPPELREGSGEIEAAQKSFKRKVGGLPDLIEVSDVKGDLQIHSDFDIETSHDLGQTSMKEILVKARLLGYEYVAFTEHNPSQKGHNKKQIKDLLKRKKEAVENINDWGKKNKMPFAFNSLEIDILPGGGLPVDDVALGILDFALVSIHSSFRQSKSEVTKRVLNALTYPKVKIFAHPTGRKINGREGVDVDWDVVFEFCKVNNKYLEINADPMRLDLPDHLVFEAVKRGVKLTMGTDSHHSDHMDNMPFAVSVSRRGWAQKEDVLNCLNLRELKGLLKID